jgi:hypothetical protein
VSVALVGLLGDPAAARDPQPSRVAPTRWRDRSTSTSKNQHYELVPGLLEFIDEYTSERAWGPDGYLVDEGLVTLADEERQAQRSNAIGLNPMWR